MPRATALDPTYRAAAWRELTTADPLDVLVVGGGVTGAGVALDAVTRGLRVGLVEQRDLASGTSSRSSKLFHGGVRYLEQMNFGLVREALRERELMLTRLAPHLVRAVSFLYPLERGWERPYVTAGLTLYDQMGGERSVPGHRQLSRARVKQVAPGLRDGAHQGGLLYHDAQADDARHTLTVARTAATYGASILTSAQVVGLLEDGERVVGATVLDVETGEEHQVRACCVIVCAGVWTDAVQSLVGGDLPFRVRASKGVHVVVPRDRIDSSTGLILRTESSVLFCIPWGSHWLIGTTDTDWSHDLAHPSATRADVDYLLAEINEVLARPLVPEDVEGVFAGLRPLLAEGDDEGSTASLSREHAVARTRPGLVCVAGGKYTTYRVMAKDAVEAASEDLDDTLRECITDEVPLIGADGYRVLVNQAERIARDHGLPVWRVQHLLDRFGGLVDTLLDLGAADPTLLAPVPGAQEYLQVEIVHAVTHEGALHLEDVLCRRTRISIEERDRGVAAAPAVADLMAPHVGWDEEARDREVAAYLARVEAERLSQVMPDDASSDAARLAAPEVREVRPLSR